MVNRSPHEHDSDRTEPFPAGELLLLVGLNLLPAAGVLFWGWRSFDLIFLYWMENLVIGAFTLLRMVVRPYRHVIDWVFPVFLAPFFAMPSASYFLPTMKPTTFCKNTSGMPRWQQSSMK